MRDDLARSALTFAMGTIMPLWAMLMVRLFNRVYPDPGIKTTDDKIAAVRRELRKELESVRDDSREMVKRTRHRIADDLGRPKDAYDSHKVGAN